LHRHEVKSPIAVGRPGRRGALALAIASILWARPAPSSAAPPRPAPPNDAQISRAIRRGLDYIYSRPRDAGNWQSPYAARYPGGVEALVALTTLEVGEQADKAALREVIDALDRAEIETVYGRSLRAMVYARLPGETYGRRLAADVKWLIDNQQPNGGWGYGPGHPTTQLRRDWTDNSNSQFATMALRRAAGAGANVPPGVWRRCGNYWRAAQNADGGWGFEPQGPPGSRLRPESYGSMTAAGVASLLALCEKVGPTRREGGARGRRRAESPPDCGAIARGLEWLAGNYSLTAVPGWVYGRGDEWLYYYLFALVRAGEAAGLRALADRDSFGDLVGGVLAAQRDDGGWPAPLSGEPADPTVRACFAVMALARARRPVMINRLSLGDTWETDCRDAANLAEWFGRRFVTWQLLSPSEPDWSEALGDSPVLYINERNGAALGESIEAPLREFVRSGGTILVQPFGGDEKFAAQVRSFFARLFPRLTERRLDARHPVFKLHFQIPPDKQPKGTHLSDTLRSRVFILTSDLSGAWHRNDFRRSPEAFEFAANVVLYTRDKLGLPGRFSARRPPAPAPAPMRWIDIARVRHRGDWDICPRAAARLTEVLAEALSLGVRQAPPVALDEDVPSEIAMLWITGTVGPGLTGEQVRRLETYVRRGGTVFVDSAMGNRRFFQDVRASLEEAFGPEAVRRLDRSSPLITGRFAGGAGSDISTVRYTRTVAEERPRLRAPELWGIELDGRVAVVLSPYGVICPVEGYPTFGCRGLHGDDARRLAANVLLYAATR